jgi:hypothetical protein
VEAFSTLFHIVSHKPSGAGCGNLPTLYFLAEERTTIHAVGIISFRKQSITFPVAMGDFFTIKYIHSVDKLPVYDDFQVSGPGEFMLLQTRQHTFGAGLGDWQGEVKFEDGLQVIKNINKKFTELHLRVGRVADHTFFVGDSEIPLSQTFLGGELVVVRIVKE